jgi:HD-GYP domain-containing protein (c-di-GMP phosphodiesterase class II)
MAELNMTRESEKEDILLLAKVHDIGKITIPDHILNKPGRLTSDEFEIIKKHSEAGYKIIKNITDSDQVSSGVLSHHERWDGNGYPQGLKGYDIPIYARIISVVDAYDAMTSNRVYQKMKSKEQAIAELIKCSGSQFDPMVVNAFIAAMTK